MFPGNMGTGTAMDAQVNRRKKATKVAPALISSLYPSGKILLLDKTLQKLRTGQASIRNSSVTRKSLQIPKPIRTLRRSHLRPTLRSYNGNQVQTLVLNHNINLGQTMRTSIIGLPRHLRKISQHNRLLKLLPTLIVRANEVLGSQGFSQYVY